MIFSQCFGPNTLYRHIRHIHGSSRSDFVAYFTVQVYRLCVYCIQYTVYSIQYTVYSIQYKCIDCFHGVWLHFWRARSVFRTAVCKIQASKRYIESLPLVLKDRRSCPSQSERSTVQLPLDRALALQK